MELKGFRIGATPFSADPDEEGESRDSDRPCPVQPNTTPAPSAKEAGLDAVRWERAQQKAARDNNERSFGIIPHPNGGFTFYHGRVGTPDDVPIVVKRTAVGAGHLHTEGGGDTLSRAERAIDPWRDIERISDMLGQLGHPEDFVTILGGENGRVYAWIGENLTAEGEDIGSDQCE